MLKALQLTAAELGADCFARLAEPGPDFAQKFLRSSRPRLSPLVLQKVHLKVERVLLILQTPALRYVCLIRASEGPLQTGCPKLVQIASYLWPAQNETAQRGIDHRHNYATEHAISTIQLIVQIHLRSSYSKFEKKLSELVACRLNIGTHVTCYNFLHFESQQ